jgi:N-acylglucosamine-6-phosphate 2-epimerase
MSRPPEETTVLLVPYGSLIVSCQAEEWSPLRAPTHMAAMAQTAELGGAAGFRVEGAADVAAVRASTELPIIGIKKGERGEGRVYITAEFGDAEAVVRAGASSVALDATDRPRPGEVSLSDLVARIHDELGVPVLGDVDSLQSGIFALSAGVDALASTLSGYTGGQEQTGPDLALVKDLVGLQACPVIAEGRITTPEHVQLAFEYGAHAVVVGKAITDPSAITRRFVRASPSGATTSTS